MKYVDAIIGFPEVPDEISLCINISGCPNHCPGCHSSYLWDDIGKVLNKESLFKLIDEHNGISCVCLMGGDQAPNTINWLAKCVKEKYPNLKVAWYSGSDVLPFNIDLDNFNYIKLGPYKEECGPLTEKTTNQRFYEYNKYYSDYTIGFSWRNVTYKFWKNDSEST